MYTQICAASVALLTPAIATSHSGQLSSSLHQPEFTSKKTRHMKVTKWPTQCPPPTALGRSSSSAPLGTRTPTSCSRVVTSRQRVPQPTPRAEEDSANSAPQGNSNVECITEEERKGEKDRRKERAKTTFIQR